VKFDVYGVGNALVDKEFEVDESFFQDHGIEKGLMTLGTDEESLRLLGILTEKYGVKKQAGGGSAANTLYAVVSLAAKHSLAAKWRVTTQEIFSSKS
jgi:sugar/nucleoside kinase (ribokinase family)